MTGSVRISVDSETHRRMLEGTVGAMLFGALDEGEKYSDIDPDLRRTLSSDCAVFLYLLDTFSPDRPATWGAQSMARSSILSEPERAGNDLWFTRAGDGVGFWDGDWDKPGEHEIGDYLTWLAKLIPQCEVYVGDDRMIYGTW